MRRAATPETMKLLAFFRQFQSRLLFLAKAEVALPAISPISPASRVVLPRFA